MNGEEKVIQRITRLFLKEIAGELTSGEQVELEEWLRRDSERRNWYERMKSLDFVQRDYACYADIKDPLCAWECLERDLKRRRVKNVWLWGCAVAMVLVMIVGSTLLLTKQSGRGVELRAVREPALISLVINNGQDSVFLNVSEEDQLVKGGGRMRNNTLTYDSVGKEERAVEYHDLSVGRGGEFRLVLSDGTVVWLNSESSLRYPVHFSGTRREVELTGEAFFQVSPHEEMPFEVKGGNFSVTVLGTSFNIMNYADERYAEVTLASGKLRVNKGDQHVVIHPDEQVQLDAEGLNVRQVDARYYTTWMESKFMFHDASLDVIVRKLARWYNLGYNFIDPSLKETRFSGQLLKYDDITKAFELLEMTTDVRFTINQKTIQIMKEK